MVQPLTPAPMGGLAHQDSSGQEPEHARLTLEGMGPLGDTLASYQGDVVNVFGGIPGEEVRARIVRFNRLHQRQVSALVVEVLKPSPHRVSPPCPYFGPCSGCQWQHMEYSYQLRLKQEAVQGCLKSYPRLEGVPVRPVLPSLQPLNYRNHARLTVRHQGTLGYVNRITRRFVRIDECMLMAPWINETLRQLQGNCQETSQLSIRYGENTGEWLIQPRMQGKEVPLPTGQTHYAERVRGKRFRIASPSFFQVNTRQAERVIELVRARLKLSGNEVLVDAYAGVGTFGVTLAPFVRRVISIEESPAAVKDAAVNALGIENLELMQGKAEEVLSAMSEPPDAVILDPPRVGCHPSTLAALIRRPPRRIVYVSCDPATLARDLDALAQGGFEVEALEPVDMFPQTYHVECVAPLEHRG